MALNPHLLIVVTSGLTLMLLLLWLVAAHPRASMLVLLMAVVAEGNLYASVDLSTTVASFRITIFDAFFVAFATVGLTRLGAVSTVRGTKSLVLTIGALTTLATISWSFSVGIQPAVVEWRPMLLSVACWIWAISAVQPWSISGMWPFAVAGIVAACVQWVEIAHYGLGAVNVAITTGDATLYGRTNTAAIALVMVVAFWVIVANTRLARWIRLPLAAVLFITVVFAQHRTAWIALISSSVVYGLVALVRGRRIDFYRVTLASVVSLGLASVAWVLVSSVPQLATSSGETGNWEWRTETWIDYLDAPRSLADLIVGAVVGPTPSTDGTLFTFSSHSMYVQTFAWFGLTGFTVVIGIVLAQAWSGTTSPVNPIPWISTAIALSWSVSYEIPAWYWLVIGIASTRATCMTQPDTQPILEHRLPNDPRLFGSPATSSR